MDRTDRGLYFDIDGKPISLAAWCLLNTAQYKRVAEDTIEVGDERYWVSTVWLGLDHGFGFSAQPLIFETMVFDAEGVQKSVWEGGDWHEKMMDRYATKEQALNGHQRICNAVRVMAEVGQHG